MRRFALSFLIVLCAATAAAQTRDRRVPVSSDLTIALETFENTVRRLTTAISRDSFILSQVMLAANDLRDFQKSIEISKAIDRVNAATKRAVENPPAAPEIMMALANIRDTLSEAQRQGATADFAAAKRTLLTKSEGIQRTLFEELSAARRERSTLIAAQTRLAQASQQLDTATAEAMGTALDFVRASAK